MNNIISFIPFKLFGSIPEENKTVVKNYSFDDENGIELIAIHNARQMAAHRSPDYFVVNCGWNDGGIYYCDTLESALAFYEIELQKELLNWKR